ncbi:hypothetical protein IFM89_013412 [Coptis chinensis]|uniref:Uncharacterized protein n=1 Tax=Coptis chinensis TaxID=261450 RepID=A0A835GW01_9MAGN|nr:hypothetical protein IFM89_013412 [Coptis chinensis]
MATVNSATRVTPCYTGEGGSKGGSTSNDYDVEEVEAMVVSRFGEGSLEKLIHNKMLQIHTDLLQESQYEGWILPSKKHTARARPKHNMPKVSEPMEGIVLAQGSEGGNTNKRCKRNSMRAREHSSKERQASPQLRKVKGFVRSDSVRVWFKLLQKFQHSCERFNPSSLTLSSLKLAAGAISEIVDIADTIKACRLSNSEDDFAAWDKSLGALEQLGMNTSKRLDTEIEPLKEKARRHEVKLLAEVNSPCKMPLIVEVISKETIKPSSPTLFHLRTFKLSLIDQYAFPVYVPLVLFYSAKGKYDVKDRR